MRDMMMKFGITTVAVLALSMACSPAPQNVALTLDDALAADRAFAGTVKAEGPKAAFLKHFDANGKFYEPGVVTNGVTDVANGFDGTPPGFTIVWMPEGGEDSGGGDIAVTTGRYEVKIEAVTIDAGRYFAVWRRTNEGLKVVMQSRLPDPPPAVAGQQQ